MSPSLRLRFSKITVMHAIGLIALIAFGACSKKGDKPPSIAKATLVTYARTGAVAQPDAIPNDSPEDGQWTMPGKNPASSRYSKLDQINATNAGALRPVMTFSTGVNRGHEAAPLVVNNTMYIITPYPNILYALDLTKPGAPAKWIYKPK